MRYFLIFTLAITSLFSCKDLCKDKFCGDYGVCDDGSCICEDWYMQDSSNVCSLEKRSIYLGDFSGIDYCSSITKNYNVNVSTINNLSYAIAFGNLYNKGQITIAKIDEADKNTFRIYPQNYNLGIIEGSGSIDRNTGKIFIRYYITVQASIDTCNLALTPM